jgi:hypothetical protein
MLKERPELTQSEIAREVGVSQPMVSKIITKSLLQKKVICIPSAVIRLTSDPGAYAVGNCKGGGSVASLGYQVVNQFFASTKKVNSASAANGF